MHRPRLPQERSPATPKAKRKLYCGKAGQTLAKEYYTCNVCISCILSNTRAHLPKPAEQFFDLVRIENYVYIVNLALA